MTLLMERLWAGHESIAPDLDAIFLWISDSPELNIQSKEKIEAASDVFPRSRLVVIENDFNQEQLFPGHIYFLNTQKLGVSSLLTKSGDGRTWTIWQSMLVFRREGGKVKVDILDPHDESRGDAAEKAAGLADFARKHGPAFGRIELIRIVNGQIQRLRLHQELVRDKVLKVTDLKHLAELYGQHS
jgi:type III restriction enzyme